jgi:hypothetical protein
MQPAKMQLSTGQIIKAPFLPSTAEVKKFELRSGYALLEVILHDMCQFNNPMALSSAVSLSDDRQRWGILFTLK